MLNEWGPISLGHLLGRWLKTESVIVHSWKTHIATILHCNSENQLKLIIFFLITEHGCFIDVSSVSMFETALFCHSTGTVLVKIQYFHPSYFIPCHLSITCGRTPRWFPCIYIWLMTCQHHCQIQCHRALPTRKDFSHLAAGNRTDGNQGHSFASSHNFCIVL